MANSRRAVAGVVVMVVAALVLVVALRAHGGTHPSAASAGSASHPADAAQGGLGQAAGRPSSPSASSTRPASHTDPFAGAAADYAASREGTVLAAVYDVRTGQSWRLGDGQAQAEASVVKLNILQALLARQSGTPLSPDEQGLARSMIEDSDNDAATSLWDEAGGAVGLSSYNVRAGLARTTPSSCVVCTGFPWPGWGLTTTVPYDQLTLLKQLVVPGPQPLLSAAARAYALSLMENVSPDQRWGISGGVPADVTVALKNGWLPLNADNTNWQVNSVGWVSGDGRDYLIAVFSTGNPAEQYGIDTINALSAQVWSAMR